MKTVRTAATILFILSRILSFLLLIISTYGLIVSGLARHLSDAKGLPVRENADHTFTIFYPFTTTPFLVGDSHGPSFTVYILVMFLYGVFVWMLSNVFKGFKQPRLFIQKNVSRLRLFYLFNFIIPVVFLICMAVLGEEISDAVVIVLLHMMIGVFAWFMSVIFQQGLLLQEEQDLTL